MPEENDQGIVQVTQQALSRPRMSLAETMAHEYGMEAGPFMAAIKQVVFPALDRKGNPPTDAQMVAYLAVCHQVGLNPFAGMVWPFPMRDGGFRPVTSIDGWLFVMNKNPNFLGYEYEEILDEKGALIAGEMTIYRKDRDRPIVHREYLSENRRDTEPWKMIHRMMENRTTCQTVRRAMGISGIMDSDEAEEINITSQSVELERSTAKATVGLKEQIQTGIAEAGKQIAARRGRPPTSSTVGQVPPQVTATSVPVTPPMTVTPSMPGVAVPPSGMVTGIMSETPSPDTPPLEPGFDGGLPFEELELEPGPQQDPNALISDADRNDLLTILKSAPGETAHKQVGIRQMLISLGYSNTKEIKYRHYDQLLTWAKQVQF